jgi:hypothetical protein
VLLFLLIERLLQCIYYAVTMIPYSSFFFPYLKLMLDARRKLPRHVGAVWRGVKGVDLSTKYTKGSEVYWWAFSSTTKELLTLQTPNFLGTSGVRTIFMIQVKRGVDIVRYSIFQGEEAEA